MNYKDLMYEKRFPSSLEFATWLQLDRCRHPPNNLMAGVLWVQRVLHSVLHLSFSRLTLSLSQQAAFSTWTTPPHCPSIDRSTQPTPDQLYASFPSQVAFSEKSTNTETVLTPGRFCPVSSCSKAPTPWSVVPFPKKAFHPQSFLHSTVVMPSPVRLPPALRQPMIEKPCFKSTVYLRNHLNE